MIISSISIHNFVIAIGNRKTSNFSNDCLLCQTKIRKRKISSIEYRQRYQKGNGQVYLDNMKSVGKNHQLAAPK
jgi:hypothetical protein